MRYFDDFKTLVEKRIVKRECRDFAFEYELIAKNPLSKNDFSKVQSVLPSLGFLPKEGKIICDSGMYITFEPGGQLEFSSPPLLASETEKFDFLLEKIKSTVEAIKRLTNVEYLPVPFIPGRAKAPMLLEAKRYHDLHDLLGRVSDRGREMMKGTAAIHLHASLLNFEELLRLWSFLCGLSRDDDFAMGEQRRDIWNKTDPSRCGLRCTNTEEIYNSNILFENLISFAMNAIELESGLSFSSIQPHPSFDEFMIHFTTIF